MNIPAELKYSKDHEWIRLEGETAYVGITDFAQHELGDIAEVFVQPCAPYRGKNISYEPNALPSAYVSDDIETFDRIRSKRQ